MHDPYSSEIVVQAEIEYRRRLLAPLPRITPIERQHKLGVRAALAEALVHLALHLDGRSVGSVAAQHVRPGGHSHGRPA